MSPRVDRGTQATSHVDADTAPRRRLRKMGHYDPVGVNRELSRVYVIAVNSNPRT